jgi:hypothetical protein
MLYYADVFKKGTLSRTLGAELLLFQTWVRDTLLALDAPPKISGHTWIDQDPFSGDIDRSGS